MGKLWGNDIEEQTIFNGQATLYQIIAITYIWMHVTRHLLSSAVRSDNNNIDNSEFIYWEQSLSMMEKKWL